MVQLLVEKTVACWAVVCFFLGALVPGILHAAEGEGVNYGQVREGLIAEFGSRKPAEWGMSVDGVATGLATGENVIALTLDACGGPKGNGYDAELISFLEQQNIPATLFVNARWIDANSAAFLKLAGNPLFTVANHGYRHRPASVNGRGIYGINGTRGVAELADEIWLNAEKIHLMTGKRSEYYRSGTAFYDEVAVEVAGRLGHRVIGFSVIGDGGATFTKEQVKAALLTSKPGSIVILHMNRPGSGTAEGVKAAVPLLKARGFRFVNLAEYPLDRAGGR
jgi:peptidoglycan/xylan/chitin deacetylase (PgdA/CDA1 family)